jgi:AraC-like DNA-binding protein
VHLPWQDFKTSDTNAGCAFCSASISYCEIFIFKVVAKRIDGLNCPPQVSPTALKVRQKNIVFSNEVKRFPLINHMSLTSFLNSIILLGSIQGFIIGTILYFSSKEKLSGKLLAWLLFIMALACLKIYLNNIGFTYTKIGSFVDAFIPFMIIMLVGPLIYFYCKAELFPDFKMGRPDRKHFYPVVVDLFHHASAVVFVFILILGWANPKKNSFGIWFDTYNVYADIPRWVSLSLYLLLSFRLLNNSVKHGKLTNEATPSLSWLKELLWMFLAFDFLWLLYLVPYVIPQYTDSVLNSVDWYPVYLPLVVIIYWLGIRGFLIGRKEISQIRTPAMLQLSEQMINQTMESLHKSMIENKLYLDAGLNLTKLAKHVSVSPKIVSAVLNQKLGKSFNEYINQFRVEEVKTRLVKPENKKYTIASVAYECGFNSQPTFQRAFKTIVGLTPSEFLQQNQT